MSFIKKCRHVATIWLTFGLVGLTFTSTAGAIAMYDASAGLTLTVQGITGGLNIFQVNQSVSLDEITEEGDGSATNTTALIPGGSTFQVQVGDVFTNTAVVSGSADTSGSSAVSVLETGLSLYLLSDGSATVDFAYEFTGLVQASATDPGEFAEALSSFELRNFIDNSVIVSIEYTVDSGIAPPSAGDTIAGNFQITLPASTEALFEADVTASGVAVAVAVPTPPVFYLLIPGLLGLIFSRRFTSTV